MEHHSWPLYSRQHGDVAELGFPTAARAHPVFFSLLLAGSQAPGCLCPLRTLWFENIGDSKLPWYPQVKSISLEVQAGTG